MILQTKFNKIQVQSDIMISKIKKSVCQIQKVKKSKIIKIKIIKTSKIKNKNNNRKLSKNLWSYLTVI